MTRKNRTQWLENIFLKMKITLKKISVSKRSDFQTFLVQNSDKESFVISKPEINSQDVKIIDLQNIKFETTRLSQQNIFLVFLDFLSIFLCMETVFYLRMQIFHLIYAVTVW